MSRANLETILKELREMRKAEIIGAEIYTTVKERIFKRAKQIGMISFPY